jgi:cbb3-type cytochrome oxidase maturation protein
METIFVLLPLALLIAAIAVGLFIWAARTGQFDDLETPAIRILFDDDQPRGPQAGAGRRDAAPRESRGTEAVLFAANGAESREPGAGSGLPADLTRRVLR